MFKVLEEPLQWYNEPIVVELAKNVKLKLKKIRYNLVINQSSMKALEEYKLLFKQQKKVTMTARSC